jgi:hypothetical protein
VEGRYSEIECQAPEGQACEIAKISAIKIFLIVRRIPRKLGNDTCEYVDRDKPADESKVVRFEQPGGAEPNRVHRGVKEHVDG